MPPLTESVITLVKFAVTLIMFDHELNMFHVALHVLGRNHVKIDRDLNVFDRTFSGLERSNRAKTILTGNFTNL
jgi:hypothetical protein